MHQMVPFLDLAKMNGQVQDDIDLAIRRVAASGRYIGGAEVVDFEREWASASGAKFCVGVGNGLDAIHLALLALGVGAGDEVIVPSNTFIATWLAVTRCGATIVPVEPDPATYNIDSARIEDAITAKTKVIIPVHLYGQPADMTAISAIAKKHGLSVMDDCAQSHLSRWEGKPVGSLAKASAWSFYPGKNLGALGDGGAVTTDDPDLADRLRMLGNYGSKAKYSHELLGYNSRLDSIQAAVLSAKLQHLQRMNSERSAIARAYIEGLSDVDVVLPVTARDAEPVWHLFVVRHPSRSEFQERLAKVGVETLIHYPVPPHLQPAYAHLGFKRGDFPVSERIHSEVLSLPLWPGMSSDQVGVVVDAVRSLA